MQSEFQEDSFCAKIITPAVDTVYTAFPTPRTTIQWNSHLNVAANDATSTHACVIILKGCLKQCRNETEDYLVDKLHVKM